MADPLSTLSGWQSRAQEEADAHRTHATKRAAENVEMTPEERAAAHALYRQHLPTIKRICRHAYRKAQGSPNAPPLSEEDALQASWELFVRCLVRFDPEEGSLDTYLKHALRSRITDHLRSQSAPRSDPPPRGQSGRTAAPALSLTSVLEGMMEEDDELKAAWNELVA